MKKKFEETKVGGWLLKNAPNILDVIGDTFPPAKVLTHLVKNEPNVTEDQKLQFCKLVDSTYKDEMEYHLQNTINARSNYALSKEMADKIANMVMLWNLPILFLLVVVNIICVLYLDSAVLAIISNVIGMVMNSLINERLTTLNFYLGSSKNSEEKSRKVVK